MSYPAESAHPLYDNGQRVWEGLTIREYFAARAPVEPQEWFTPTMATECPVTPYYGDELTAEQRNEWHRIADCDELPEKTSPEVAAFFEQYHDALHARSEWRRERTRQQYVQWPWAWADAVLAASTIKPEV